MRLVERFGGNWVVTGGGGKRKGRQGNLGLTRRVSSVLPLRLRAFRLGRLTILDIDKGFNDMITDL